MPKKTPLRLELGFPETKREMICFGHQAKRINRVRKRKIDSRSFAEALLEKKMDIGGDRFTRKDGGGKQQETYSGPRGEYRDRSSSMPQREFQKGDSFQQGEDFRRGRENIWREEESRYQREEQKRKFAYHEGGSGQQYEEDEDRLLEKINSKNLNTEISEAGC